MEPYISTNIYEGKPVIEVDYRTKKMRYPLNANGCRQAGIDLFHAGIESWLCSSSVDFPNDVKPSFRGDVRQYIEQGFQQEREKEEAPKRSLIEKMFSLCAQETFQSSLTSEEKAIFVKIQEQVTPTK